MQIKALEVSDEHVLIKCPGCGGIIPVQFEESEYPNTGVEMDRGGRLQPSYIVCVNRLASLGPNRKDRAYCQWAGDVVIRF